MAAVARGRLCKDAASAHRAQRQYGGPWYPIRVLFCFFFLKKGSGVDHFDLLATGKTKTINSVDLIKLCHIWSNLSVRDVIEIEFVAFDMSAYIESTFKRTLVAEHET